MTIEIENLLLEEPMPVPPMVEISWIDAEFDSGYSRIGELRKTGLLNYDVGYVVVESEEWLVLGFERYATAPNEVAGYRRTLAVPKVLIKTITYLTPVTSVPAASSNI